MNNETVHNYTIKERFDHTFDIYIDNKHIASKGNIHSAIALLEECMNIDETLKEQKELHNDILLEINGVIS